MKLYTYFRAMERSGEALRYFASVGDGNTTEKYNTKYNNFRDGLIKRMERLEYANKIYLESYITEQIRAGNFTEKLYDKNNR